MRLRFGPVELPSDQWNSKAKNLAKRSVKRKKIDNGEQQCV